MIIRNFKINKNELFDKDKMPQHLAIIMTEMGDGQRVGDYLEV